MHQNSGCAFCFTRKILLQWYSTWQSVYGSTYSYNSKYVTLNETQFFMFSYSVKSRTRLAYIASNPTSSISMSTNKCFSSQFICWLTRYLWALDLKERCWLFSVQFYSGCQPRYRLTALKGVLLHKIICNLITTHTLSYSYHCRELALDTLD